MAFDEGVIVGQKVKRQDIGSVTGLDGGPNGADVVSKVG
jgi:hypothetical protein